MVVTGHCETHLSELDSLPRKVSLNKTFHKELQGVHRPLHLFSWTPGQELFLCQCLRIYFSLPVLGLRCCPRLLSVAAPSFSPVVASRGCSRVAGPGLLTAVASLVADRELQQLWDVGSEAWLLGSRSQAQQL